MHVHPFIKKFQNAIGQGLPGEHAHSQLIPIDRKLNSQMQDLARDYRKSAVGVVLFEASNSIYCVLIQRPQYDGIHSRQISFPGGKMDLTDPDLEYTAKREIFEEIALPSDRIQTIGELTHIYIPVSKFYVKPYVFFAEDLPELIADEREVDEIITFDIELLHDEKIIKTTDLKLSNGLIQKQVPYFDIHGKTVWGATAMMLSEFRAVLKNI